MKFNSIHCIISLLHPSCTKAFSLPPSVLRFNKFLVVEKNEVRMSLCENDNISKNSNWNRRIFFKSLISVPLSFAVSKNKVHASMMDEFEPKASKSSSQVVSKKGEASIDPTLKGSYYYPTAKKRYLPRIQKVSNSITSIPNCIVNEDWENVSLFANKVADDAILPLKLYQSSLDGQGLNMKNDYVTTMKDKANLYEEKTRELQKAAKVQNKDKAFVALNGMAEAITEYRVAGRLSDDDGNIPTVEDMRRSGMRRPVSSTLAKN